MEFVLKLAAFRFKVKFHWQQPWCFELTLKYFLNFILELLQRSLERVRLYHRFRQLHRHCLFAAKRKYLKYYLINLFINSFSFSLARHEYHLDQLFPSISCHEACETSEPRGRHPHSSLDVYEILSGFALRRPIDCHALFHLRRHRHAGLSITGKFHIESYVHFLNEFLGFRQNRSRRWYRHSSKQ